VPEAKYQREAILGSKQKMQGLHKLLTQGPENEKQHEMVEQNSRD
jgi:hypothetical protein